MSRTALGLTLQALSASDAVIALGHVAGWRTGTQWFTTQDLRVLYETLRLPEPGNPSDVLGRLRKLKLVRDDGSRAGPRKWALTPRGEDRARELLADFDYTSMTAEMESPLGAFFAHTEYPTLPPGLAPPAWAPGLHSFLERFPFDLNVFLMTRFPKDAEVDPLTPVIERLRTVIDKNGLRLHVADDHQIVDDLWGNVGAHMWACRYGIGILETRTPRPPDGEEDARLETLNDNVLIELGSMLTIGRRCMILRDPGAPMPPTDLTAQIFKTVDLDDLEDVAEITSAWIVNDLRLP